MHISRLPATAALLVAALATLARVAPAQAPVATPLGVVRPPRSPTSTAESASRMGGAWKGAKWGALIGGAAAGVVCAAQEDCRKDGGILEDAVFGAVAGALLGAVAGAALAETVRADGRARLLRSP